MTEETASSSSTPAKTRGEARYSAFVSYSHRDAAFARRLHARLERYRLPKYLARVASQSELNPRRLSPVFLDRAELATGSDLTAAVRSALAESACLIVLCTPDSAQSMWVGREIRLFRELHGDGTILVALVRGEPNVAFHPELLHRQDGAHQIPLAADFRRAQPQVDRRA